MRVRYYGPIGRLSGYGRAGTDLCLSLLAAGVDLEIRPIERRPEEAKIAFDGGPCQALLPYMRHEYQLAASPDAIIVHTLPMDCCKVMGIEMSRDSGLDPDIPWIAYTTWEASSQVPNEVILSLAEFDMVWVPSAATREAFEPIHNADWLAVVPHSFDPRTLGERCGDGSRPVEEPPFRFYYVGAWTSRKNPAGILRAWAMAFAADDPVELYLHSHATQEAFAIALHQTGLQPQQMAKVQLFTERLTESQMYARHQAADCFVSATRGEAWDLPAFDAMLAGRHIIHPRNMGSDDFLAETSAQLFGGALLPASVDVQVTERMNDGVKLSVIGAQGLSSRSTWQEPDLVALAAMMKRAAADRRRTLTTKYDPVERYSYTAVGKQALALLEDLT